MLRVETPEQVVLSACVSITKRDDSHLENAVRAVSGNPLSASFDSRSKTKRQQIGQPRIRGRPPAIRNPSADTHTASSDARDRNLQFLGIGLHRASQRSD